MVERRQETIADIIAEKRRQADEIERDVAEKMKRNKMISDRYARELVADIRQEADRLEAAHRRERGDCAKLREALEAIDKNTDLLDIAENIAPELHPSRSFVAVQIRKIVRDALDTTSKQNTQEEN